MAANRLRAFCNETKRQGHSLMKTTHPNKILTGIAGEYFVAAELSRRGYVASLTLRNTRGIDILASNTDATKSVGIQEKGKGSGVNGTKLSRIPFIDCHLWSSVATATQPAKDAA